MGRQSAWGISIASFNNICIDLRLLSGAWLCGLFFYGWDTLREKIQPALHWKISEAKSRAKIQTEQINFHQMREWMWAGINQPKSWCERTAQSFCCTPAVQGRVSSSPASLSTCSWCMKWDLWETLEGQINFSSVENMNKVTALHHKFKIYWVDLQLNEIPRTTSQYNFTCWLNKRAMSFDAQLTAAVFCHTYVW